MQEHGVREQTDETFESLYRCYYEAILRHLYGLVQHREQAEDLAQETFTRAYRAFPKLASDAEANVRAWLYRIATNVAYDVLRRRRLLTFASLDGNEQDESHWYAEGTERDDPQRVYEGPQEAIHLTLQRMTPRHRRAVMLGCLYDYSNEQLATAFGLRNAKMLRMRARKEFCQCYAEVQRLLHEEAIYDGSFYERASR